MGRRPGSRASRAERRMQKERAASALKRGLPVPTPVPGRTRNSGSFGLRGQSQSSAPPAARALGGPEVNRRMPAAVKLLGLGILLLGIVYGLTVFRDHKTADADGSSVAPETRR
jgi:hypothetical protein